MTSKINANGKLGTFSGVFTPSMLTILGVILFLRLGFVTGSAGMGKALIIITIANLISIITSTSLSAIATALGSYHSAIPYGVFMIAIRTLHIVVFETSRTV